MASISAEALPIPSLSDHFDGKSFFNPTLPRNFLPGFSSVFKMMREPRARWPRSVANIATPQLPQKLASREIALTFVNHATFLIQFAGINVLTDPVWSENAGPYGWIGPRRVRKPGIDLDALPQIDLILISHNHYDHLDLPTLKRLNRKFAPRVLAPLGLDPLIRSTGVKDVQTLDWWQQTEFSPDLTITFAPTQHFSGRTLWDRQQTLWGSFLLQTRDRQLYYGADGGYSTHFAEIGRRLGPPDLALLGIGAYAPRWFMQPMHMHPEEAVQAHRDLGARQSVGMHFGTFQLSAEGIDQPVIDLQAALKERGIPADEFLTLSEGETRVF